jgi:Lar family restriction alleviation protein
MTAPAKTPPPYPAGIKTKPCPFCGNKEAGSDKLYPMQIIHYRTKETVDAGYRIYCYKCGVYGPKGKNRQEAVAAWNRRKKERNK